LTLKAVHHETLFGNTPCLDNSALTVVDNYIKVSTRMCVSICLVQGNMRKHVLVLMIEFTISLQFVRKGVCLHHMQLKHVSKTTLTMI